MTLFGTKSCERLIDKNEWLTVFLFVWASQCDVGSFTETEEVQVFFRLREWNKKFCSGLLRWSYMSDRFPSADVWLAGGYSQQEFRREIWAAHRKLWVCMVYRWHLSHRSRFPWKWVRTEYWGVVTFRESKAGGCFGGALKLGIMALCRTLHWY